VAAAARELTLAPNTVSTLVRQLTLAGLVSRSDDPDDRRVARLDLSDETRSRIDAWRDRRVLALTGAISHLPLREQHLLERAVPLLQRLAQLLDAEVTGGSSSPARTR
jgi:DNA-binding MarR family transcriptional regulator